jgi:hypothetical protein
MAAIRGDHVRRARAWLLFLVLVAGAAEPSCGRALPIGRSYALGSRWLPLTHVVEDPTKTIGRAMTTTIVPFLFVRNLDDWLTVYKPRGARFEALLRHEHVHAVHQLESLPPLAGWLERYISGKHFRWREEREGYFEEILYRVQSGETLKAPEIAHALATDYEGEDGPMIDMGTAQAWVLSAIETAEERARPPETLPAATGR